MEYSDDLTNRIIQGHALDVLPTLPEVDMVMTSPPYWGLRNYGTEPQIWGGDKDCRHEWGGDISAAGDIRFRVGHNTSVRNNKNPDIWNDPKDSSFCIKCGAWRGELGLEPHPDLYVRHLCDIIDAVPLKETGTVWVNLGDTYAGAGRAGSLEYAEEKHTEFGRPFNMGRYQAPCPRTDIPDKSLTAVPARFQVEMINRGWILRNVIIWHKPNCMPASVSDRFTVDFDYLFFFSKNRRYYFEQQFEDAKDWGTRNRDNYRNGTVDTKLKHHGFKNCNFSENGRNMRCVWEICPRSFPEAHFATYPVDLCITPIKAGCPVGGVVLDPFMGSGTTAVAAYRLGRKWLGIELNPEYVAMAYRRIEEETRQMKLEL